MPEPTSAIIDDSTADPVDKRSETISGGPTLGMLGIRDNVASLGRRSGHVERRYGDRVYELISLDPSAGGSVDLLVRATHVADPTIVPRYRARPGRPADEPEREKLSKEVADHAARTLENLEMPIQEVDAELSREAMEYGASLAELVWDVPSEGVDANTLVLKSIKPKARGTWAFAVDEFWNVRGIVAINGRGTGWNLLPREKFVIRTFGSRGGDPRGWSIYDRAAEAWNFRSQVPAEHFRFLKRFGSPRPIGKLGPNNEKILGLNPDGTFNPSLDRQPNQALLDALIAWINGQTVVVDYGQEIEIPDPQTKGEVFTGGLDYYKREIVVAILLQARATMESEHGSRADSETQSDVMGNLIRWLRRWAARTVEWDVLYKIASYRFGKAVAAEHTPRYDMGQADAKDIAKLLGPFSALGLRLIPDQFPDIYAMLGLPVSDAETILAQLPATPGWTDQAVATGDAKPPRRDAKAKAVPVADDPDDEDA